MQDLVSGGGGAFDLQWEDKRCARGHIDGEPDLCAECEIPICHWCEHAFQSRPQVLPRRALSNNLWTGFASPKLAQENVTYLEAILASPCMLSLVCFTLEGPYGTVLQEEAQGQRWRVGARGNITMFPLPLEDIMAGLGKQVKGGLDLPWVGCEIVREVLRTSELSDARVICQARVRRAVVVQLIEECVARKHPAYQHVMMGKVRVKAAQLPEEGVLEELAALARQASSAIENLQASKHATPPLGERDMGMAFAV